MSKTETSSNIYTVDNVLHKLAVVGNNKIWKSIPDVITVRGVVSNVKTYPKTAYFDLSGSGKRIKACCDLADTPSEGVAIEFQGLVELKTNEFGTSLQVLLKGTPVGAWERYEHGSTMLTSQDLVKYNSQGLSSLMEEIAHGHQFILIGSDTGINDVVGSVNNDLPIKFDKKFIRVSSKSDVIKEVELLKRIIEPVSGFAVVRGGEDPSLVVWDDPDVVKALLNVDIPFFTALGHTHCVSLADKYAAQSFPTPGNLGSSINDEFKRYRYQQSLLNQNKQLQEEGETALNEVDHLKARSRKQFYVILLLVMIIVALGYVFLSSNK